jgi:hypothetical protein
VSTCSFSCSPGPPTGTWRWTSPGPSFGRMFEDAGGSGKPRIGQIALSYDPDEPIAIKRAMEQFRWFTGGWRINAELPVPASFEVASRTVREEDMAAQMPWCRSAGTAKSSSSPGRQPSCCQPSERPDPTSRIHCVRPCLLPSDPRLAGQRCPIGDATPEGGVHGRQLAGLARSPMVGRPRAMPVCASPRTDSSVTYTAIGSQLVI